jgi:transketolase N-terminal domain/subunit
MDSLKKQIISISYKKGLSHIGSCLSSVGMIDEIYKVMKPGDHFVLGNSHAALALYCVLEKNGKGKAIDMVEKHGTHAFRDENIEVSGGSLGQAETVAVGLAMADRIHDTYLVTSDGACAEGAVWEALRIARDNRLENLRITVIANGYGGLSKIDTTDLDTRLNAFYPVLVARTNLFEFPDWIQGLDGHYVKLDKEKYDEMQ